MQFWRRLLKVPYIKFSPKYKNHRDFYLQEQCRLTKLTWDTIRYERKMDHLADYEKIAVDRIGMRNLFIFPFNRHRKKQQCPGRENTKIRCLVSKHWHVQHRLWV